MKSFHVYGTEGGPRLTKAGYLLALLSVVFMLGVGLPASLRRTPPAAVPALMIEAHSAMRVR